MGNKDNSEKAYFIKYVCIHAYIKLSKEKRVYSVMNKGVASLFITYNEVLC